VLDTLTDRFLPFSYNDKYSPSCTACPHRVSSHSKHKAARFVDPFSLLICNVCPRRNVDAKSLSISPGSGTSNSASQHLTVFAPGLPKVKNEPGIQSCKEQPMSLIETPVFDSLFGGFT
jgi:hypothetical protein